MESTASREPRGAAEELRIERATLSQGPALQALQRRCTHSATFDVEKYNHPDFFDRSRVYEESRVFVAHLGSALVGSQGGGVREAVVGGEVQKVGYMFQLFVAPEAQGRGIAGKLRSANLAFFREQGCRLCYTIVAGGNERSHRVAAKNGDLPTRLLTLASMPVHRPMRREGGGTIRPFVAADAAAVAELANRTWAGHEMYEPQTADKLLRDLERIPGCGKDSLLVLEEGGSIVACAGFWNASEVERVTVRSLSAGLWATAMGLDVLRLVKEMPRVPRPGETLRHWMLRPLGWERIDQLGDLFRALNDRALAAGIGQLFLLCEARHPVLEALAGFFKVEIGLDLLTHALEPGAALGGGPLFVDPTDQ